MKKYYIHIKPYIIEANSKNEAALAIMIILNIPIDKIGEISEIKSGSDD